MGNKIDHIIARVLVGEASAEDIFELSNWLNEDVSHQQEFKQLKNYWDAEISMSHSILPTISAENLQHKIETQNKISHKKQVMKYLFSLAASITLIVLLSTGYLMKKINSSDGKYYTYLTNENKTDLTLDDGTRITINKNSRLITRCPARRRSLFRCSQRFIKTFFHCYGKQFHHCARNFF